MEPIDVSRLPHDALVVLDSAPIIYLLEDHPKYRRRFEPIFESHAAGHVRFAIGSSDEVVIRARSKAAGSAAEAGKRPFAERADALAN